MLSAVGFQSRNASARFNNLPRDVKSHVHDWFVCRTLPNPATLRSFLSNCAHSRSPVVWTALRSFPSNRAHSRSPVVWTALRSFLSNRAHSRSPVVWTALMDRLSPVAPLLATPDRRRASDSTLNSFSFLSTHPPSPPPQGFSFFSVLFNQ